MKDFICHQLRRGLKGFSPAAKPAVAAPGVGGIGSLPSPVAFFAHPAAVATLGLSAVEQACDLGWDKLVAQASSSWAAGQAGMLPAAGLTALALAPAVLTRVRERARLCWREDAAKGDPRGGGMLAGRVDLAAETANSLLAVLAQGTMLSNTFDGAPRVALAAGALGWAALGLLAWHRSCWLKHGKDRCFPVATLELVAHALGLATQAVPLALGATAALQAHCGLSLGLADSLPLVPAACDVLAVVGPALMLSARLPRLKRHLDHSAKLAVRLSASREQGAA